VVEIGRGKSGRRAYALDEIGIVPSRRTRHPEEVSIAWQIDAYRFEMPLVVAPMDSVVSPATAIAVGRPAASPRWTSRACGPGTKTPSRCWPKPRSLTTTRPRGAFSRSIPSR